MTQFVYEGPYGSLYIAGRSVYRGEPFEVADDAAGKSAAAELAAHPDIHEIKVSKAAKAEAGQPSALAERQALVARAKELGIPAKGKSAELAAAIAEAEAAAAAG